MKLIKLTNDTDKVIVDDDIYEFLNQWKWCSNKGINKHNNYAHKTTKPNISMHRLIMGNPKGLEIDHINHNKLDNRRCNLRIVTVSENQLNRKKK